MVDRPFHKCLIPDPFIDYLLNGEYIHFCTLDQQRRPHVVPLLFTFQKNGCLIRCVGERDSTKIHNIRQYPFVSFTIHEVHPTIPLLNSGIMTEAIAEIIEDTTQIAEAMKKLKQKYVDQLKSEIIAKDIDDSDILIEIHPLRIVYWKGPFFEHFSCPNYRKTEDGLWEKIPASSTSDSNEPVLE
ncbi:MAG: pyridoxamine 5'-phosphate oxidase family protein [Candidatus Hodarchaeales archaeon]